ncbi:hypothetical protein PI125_g15536 [Phytophthora idaei]|nr:hypothetical protein PI125_g15536 [Phytophthora idaei]
MKKNVDPRPHGTSATTVKSTQRPTKQLQQHSNAPGGDRGAGEQ